MPECYAPLIACLPDRVRRELLAMAEGYADFWTRLFEIRLRASHHVALTVDGRNLLLSVILDHAELSTTFSKLCDNSIYAHAESLRQGYLTAYGCRVGVAGRAVREGGQVSAMADIRSLCIRIPHRVVGAGAVAARVFREMACRRGILVYSPPGVGKTTLLRDLAYTLSCGSDARRVAVVDTRGELYGADAPVACQIDVLEGYPQGAGIELVTRTLSPQVILCDEIGSEADAAAILSVAGCGVPLIASAHGGSVEEVRARAPIRLLEAGGIFGAYIGIARGETGYTYAIHREDAVCCS